MLDTARVTNMEDMFKGCKNLSELDVSGFDTTGVTNMAGMFSWCANLTQLDLTRHMLQICFRCFGDAKACMNWT